MEKPYAVVFAGVPGSSKSSIAYYLSGRFNLPVMSNDSLRYEVKEDLRVKYLNIKEDMLFNDINQPEALEEYEKRLTKRRDDLLQTRRPVIFDGSVDRRWPETKPQLQAVDYDWFMIDMELSRQFLKDLFKGTGREFFITQLDGYFEQHADFLRKYEADISLKINDELFIDRLTVAAKGLQKFLASRNLATKSVK